jgi:4-amino-4-deoxy-L-arabinose transferase-like glycosyltransferase
LWVDEASAYWTARQPLWAIVSGQGTDGTPPLYYLILHAGMLMVGSSEFALRLPSIVAGVALVPAVFLVMRQWSTVRVALLAAALVTVSPLVHYYAVEARNYALVQLETVGILYGFVVVTALPARFRSWLVLAGAQTVQLLTHIYGGFFLVGPILASVVVGPKETRVRRVTGCTLSALGATLVSAPWLRLALANSAAGVGDWIATWWTAIPPSRALLASVEAFGFGGRFPAYLTYLDAAPSAGVLSVAVSLLLIGVAILPRASRDGARPGVALALVVLTAAPLAAVWVYSMVRQPLYLPGRYDTIVLPVFLMLLAIGLDRLWDLHRWAGAVCAATVLVLAGLSWAPIFGPVLDAAEADHHAGLLLGERAAAGDRVVTFNLRTPVTAYYAARSGFAGAIHAFPSEVDAHPGWYSAPRLRDDHLRLAADGARVAADLVQAAQHGHAVWVVAEEATDIDNALLDPLLGTLEVDLASSDQASSLVCLRVR